MLLVHCQFCPSGRIAAWHRLPSKVGNSSMGRPTNPVWVNFSFFMFTLRLSGSTAEFLSMWNLMMMGHSPFTVQPDGELTVTLAPLLPAWMFNQAGQLSFKMLGFSTVT